MLHNNGTFLRCTMLHAHGRVPKEINRNAATAIDFDVIPSIGAMVCIRSPCKRSIFTDTEFNRIGAIGHTIDFMLHLSK